MYYVPNSSSFSLTCSNMFPFGFHIFSKHFVKVILPLWNCNLWPSLLAHGSGTASSCVRYLALLADRTRTKRQLGWPGLEIISEFIPKSFMQSSHNETLLHVLFNFFHCDLIFSSSQAACEKKWSFVKSFWEKDTTTKLAYIGILKCHCRS